MGLTIVILVISGALHSRSQAPLRTESAQTWVDRVLPLITQSTAQGSEINQVRANALSLSGTTVVGELDTVAAGAARTLKRFRALDPPPEVASASGLLETTLVVRAQASRALAKAMSEELSGAGPYGPAPAVAIGTAAQDFQVADRAYQLFSRAMPKLGVSIPSSVWLSNPSLYSTNNVTVFLAALKAKTSTAPVHDGAVVAVTTNPSPLSVKGHTELIQATSTLSLQVVVADLGNQPETNVPVTATINPAKKGTTATQHTTVSLIAGLAETVTFSGFAPPATGTFQLTVQLGVVPGETNTANNTKTLTLQETSS